MRHNKKQNTVPLSIAEAEYIAASTCCTQLLWMKQTLSDYSIDESVMTPYCDNMSELNISKNFVQQLRTKHIDIHPHHKKASREKYCCSCRYSN